MGNYNFENNNTEFDKTINLKDVNDEIQKIENNGNLAETTEDSDKKIHQTDSAKTYGVSRKKTTGGYSAPKNRQYNNKLIAAAVAMALLAVMVIAVGLIVMFSKKGDVLPNGNSVEEAKDIFEYSDINENYIVKGFNKNIVYLCGMTSKKYYSAQTDENTIITGYSGGRIKFSDLSMGDVVTLSRDANNGIAQQIRWATDAWKKENCADVRIDASSSSIAYDGEIYSYDEETIFMNADGEVEAKDISYADIADLVGVENTVVSVKVVKGHGEIHFKNADIVKGIKASVDFGEEYDVSGGLLIVPAGKHTVVVKGSNIEDFMTEIEVAENLRVEIDMENAVEKQSALILSVKPKTKYTAKIDGKTVNAENNEIKLKDGKYILEINAEGYLPYKKEIIVDGSDIREEVSLVYSGSSETQPSQTGVSQNNNVTDAEKKGNLTIYSEPAWAKVYIDGEYKGITPYMENLPYGEYYVELALDGYDTCGQLIEVNKPDQTFRGMIE